MRKKKYNMVKDFVKKYAGLVLIVSLFIGVEIYFQTESVRGRKQLEKEMSPAIVEIANKAGMSREGKYLFYSANPQIVGPDEYEKRCYEGEHVVDGLTRGCVISSSFLGSGKLLSARIYLRKLENPEYADAIYDSAAHEMLHIAYQRLSSREKRKLNHLLDKELERHRDDPRISLLTDDSDKLSLISHEEFYAILGSYYRDVSEELEDHFKHYFSDRDGLLKIGEASLYRSRLDEAARYKHQAITYQKKQDDISEKLYSDTQEIGREERVTLEAQLNEMSVLYSNALLKHHEVIELLE